MLGKIFSTIVDFLSPEDKELEKLFRLGHPELLRRLPKPRSINEPLVTALFDYRDDNVRAIIKAIKTKGNRTVINMVARHLYDNMIEFVSDIAIFEGGGSVVVVPIPISHKRRVGKGWSQCELICREMEKYCDKNIGVKYDLLIKTKETAKQTDLKREERLQNMRGSMEVRSKIPKNSTIIVIDDVYTTGATFVEARRALEKAGARTVAGFFVAH